MKDNATFYTFKPSGKWKYKGRGYASPELYTCWDRDEKRQRILADNGGKMPGMSTDGSDLIVMVAIDDDAEHGWPLLIHP